MKSKDIERGRDYRVYSPCEGPRGTATVMERVGDRWRVKWAPGISVYTRDRTTLVRARDIIRPA